MFDKIKNVFIPKSEIGQLYVAVVAVGLAIGLTVFCTETVADAVLS